MAPKRPTAKLERKVHPGWKDVSEPETDVIHVMAEDAARFRTWAITQNFGDSYTAFEHLLARYARIMDIAAAALERAQVETGDAPTETIALLDQFVRLDGTYVPGPRGV